MEEIGGIMATLNIKNLPDALYKKLQAQAKRERRSEPIFEDVGDYET
jgi:hypothetical protein